MRALGSDSIQFPFGGGVEVEMLLPWDEVDEAVKEHFRRVVARVGRAARQDGGAVRDDELVVLSTAGLRRLERDAWVGRALRYVVLPILAGIAFALIVDDAFADAVAIVATAALAVLYLLWEGFGPPRRRRECLRQELDAAVTRLQSARTTAPTARMDAP